MYKKKQRGQQRKLKRLIKYLEQNTATFPPGEDTYVHWHMPCEESFLNSSKTSARIKACVMQHILNCTQHLHEIKPNNIEFCRIVSLIVYPEIWSSQIIIFFDKKYFDEFFIRNSYEQTWTKICNKSIKKMRNLHINSELTEIGYLEEIHDDECKKVYKNELWFFGELSRS